MNYRGYRRFQRNRRWKRQHIYTSMVIIVILTNVRHTEVCISYIRDLVRPKKSKQIELLSAMLKQILFISMGTRARDSSTLRSRVLDRAKRACLQASISYEQVYPTSSISHVQYIPRAPRCLKRSEMAKTPLYILDLVRQKRMENCAND